MTEMLQKNLVGRPGPDQLLEPVGRPELIWEHPACNLCGGTEAEIHHREKLGYFGQAVEFTIVRCRGCRLVYTAPRLRACNEPYLQAEPAEWIETHAQAKLPVFRAGLRRLKKLQENLRMSPRGRLLDVGCGSGHFLNLARRQGFTVYGIEPAAPYAEYAREKFAVRVMAREIGAAELPAGFSDVITAWDVIEHLGDPAGALRQFRHWLTPGGLLALRFPSAAWQKLKATVLHNCLHSARPAFGPTIHLYFFSPETIRRLADRCGLEILAIHTTLPEANTGSRLADGAKWASYGLLRAAETLCRRRWGNLEVYLRKI